MGTVELDIEKYPVVDGNDNIIGFCSDKDQLHRNNYRHRGVHVFIERPAKRNRPSGFVLQYKKKGTENEETWSSSVSGHVEYGESYKTAAVREAKEELGIDIDPSELEEVLTMPACETSGNEFVKLFSYLMGDEDVIEPDPVEVAGVLVSPLKDIEKEIAADKSKFSPIFTFLLNMYISLTKNGDGND